MQSETVERVFGGINFLYWATSRREFFSHLESFLFELFGPAQFSILGPGAREDQLLIEFSNFTGCPNAEDRSVSLPAQPLNELFSASPNSPENPAEAPVTFQLGDVEAPLVWVQCLTQVTDRPAWIVFHDDGGSSSAGEEVFGIRTLAMDHVAFAYGWIRNQEDLKHQVDLLAAKLSAINAVGELIGSLDLEVLLTKLMELSLFVASAQVGSVIFVGKDQIESRVEWGLPLEVVQRLRFRDGTSILDRVLSTGEPVMIQDFGDAALYQAVPDLQVDSFMCVPLLGKGKLLGTINVINSSALFGFTREGVESILTISGIAATAIENALLHQESLARARITEDIRIAQSIQEGMFPEECPKIPGYEMAWINLNCDETGGDYFDFIPTDDHHVVVAIGDVAGHGIGAALLMATGRANLRALLSVKLGIREAMLAMDRLLEHDMDENKFMTLFIARIDYRQHRLTYLNAGQDNPLFYRRETGTVEVLASTGLPLGILGEASQHDEAISYPIGKGDVLLLASDGVWEAANSEREQFGRERLLEILPGLVNESAGNLVRAVRDHVFAFTELAEQKDDFTLVAIKRVDV